MRNALLGVLVIALAGCAANQPVPDLYAGPTAVVKDSGNYEDDSKAQIFAVVAIDGTEIMDSFWATEKNSRGRGFSLYISIIDRDVPAKPIRVTLRGGHVSATPIQAIASQMAGTFLSVEGTVDFVPKPKHRYVVRGELRKGASSVWIEDDRSGEVVTRRIVE